MDRRSPTVSPEIRGICLSIAAMGTALLATAAITACGIRLALGDDAYLSAGPALCITLLTAAWCASIRAAWLVASPQELSPKLHGVIAAAPLLSALLIARVVTFAPLTEFATSLLWFATFAQEGITLSLFVSTLFGEQLRTLAADWKATSHLAAATEPATQEPAPEKMVPLPIHDAPLHDSPALAEETLEEECLDLPPNVTQQLTRAIESGQEQVHGLVRAKFTSGQRHVYLHVGFCPPLPSVPHVELHQLEGPEVQVKPGQILTSGVRFDLKLREAPTVDALPVFEFIASAPTSEQDNLREAC